MKNEIKTFAEFYEATGALVIEKNIFSADESWTIVRGGGLGSGAWMAKIVGTHPQFKLERNFLKKIEKLSGSGKSGNVTFEMEGDGFYQFKNFCFNSTREFSGWIKVEGSEVSRVSEEEVYAAFSDKEVA